MENIELARFNFNADELIKDAAKLRDEMNKLSNANKELKKNGEDTSTQFVENDQKLKQLRSEYNQHIKVLSQAQKETKEVEQRQKQLNLVYDQEVRSIKEARDQNKLLNQLRNTAHIETTEGRNELRLLNEQLNRNNDFIKENVDQYTKQKIGIGDYKTQIKEAYRELEKEKEALQATKKELVEVRDEQEKGSEQWNYYNNQVQQTNTQINVLVQNMGGMAEETDAAAVATKLLSGDLSGLATMADEAGGATQLMGGAAKSAATGIMGMVRASLAFLATPIGIVLGVIGAAIGLVANAMNRSEESTNKLSRVFSKFTGVINLVLGALEPLGELIIDGIVAGFELLEKAALTSIRLLSGALDALGFDSAAQSLNTFTNELENAVEQSEALADAQAELERSQRKARLTQLEFQKEAENFRQIRDDESRTIQERIQANEDLAGVLEEQLIQERRIAEQALIVANLRIQQEGETKEALDAQAEALTEIADIEERVNSQRSEQLANLNSLRREAAQKAQEFADKQIEKQNQLLDLYIAEQGIRARTLQEELEIEREVSRQRQAVLDAELKAKKISQEEYKTAILEMQNDLAARQAEIAVDNAARELEIYTDNLEKRLASNEFLSAETARQRQEENNKLLEEQRAFFELQKEQGVINQNELDTAIREAQEANRIANAEIDKERKAVEKEEATALRAIEFEQELQSLIDEGASRFELERAQREEQKALEIEALNAERESNLISEELYQKRLEQIEINSARAAAEQKRILREQEVAMVANTLDAIKGIVDENSAAGKGIALAQALINTYQGITAGVKLGYPAAIPAVAAAAATGFKAVKDIMKTEIPSASGKGKVDASGGGASSTLGSGMTNMGGSGVNISQVQASNNAGVQSNVQQTANINNLDQTVYDAVFNGSRQGTTQGSQEGITALSENQQIQQQSSF